MSKTIRLRIAPLLVVGALTVHGACAPGEGERETPGTPTIVATTGMIADVAREVAGPAARVESLMATGVDPHLYKPSEGDVRRLAAADLVLYNGLHLEGKMGEILRKMSRTRPVVAVADALPADRLRAAPGYPGAHDPHVWFDVDLWSRTIEPIRAEIARLVPGREAELEANAQALRERLRTLDAWALEELSRIPRGRRALVTAHDAFGYFGARYGFEVLGLQGISTVSEAGLRDVERLVERIVRDRIPAVFVESSVPRRSIEALQAACRARGHEVAVGGELFSDSMGPPGTEEGTYEGMVRHNVATIVEALR